ncbi:hypothetical protein NQ315_012647 [Exocentrus adspersus]|uniref:Beta-galactosidase n=1 Tax=Exocentrus adspersus TaxID=1586481 RepID=A0AAV8VST4_9CUCU|nr:hypothetical protein NQ315_012647 [Exocentrus adspersus]
MALNAVFQLILNLLVIYASSQDLPTNYEYYTSEGVKSGLSADQSFFTLNGRNISIYSGAVHYFRVPREYWRDRLRKLRAAGLNTVETYIAWNLHEYESGQFDFGSGGSEMEPFLDVAEFLKIAQEEDLFAIVRSGPFICGEFEFGGFPSWLLREDMTVRTSDPAYMKYVTRFFNELMPILAPFQFQKGGPVIALQVENEYALMHNKADMAYLKSLRQLMLDNGIIELLVTSDNPVRGKVGTIPELFLMTANYDKDPVAQLDMMRKLQPGRPLMTMEYWAGWFDSWGGRHNSKTAEVFAQVYEAILSYPSSVNIYMFQGGTNFRFLNGASDTDASDGNAAFSPITTSYDYDSPLTEGGDYTDKYYKAKELLEKYNPVKTKLPEVPTLVPKVAYDAIPITGQLPLGDILDTVSSVDSEKLIPMEKLDINHNSGQSYGYIVYRKENLQIQANAVLTIEGRVCDTVMVLVNGKLVSPWLENMSDLDRFGTWRWADSYLTLTEADLTNATLDLVVENWGRVNVVSYKQYKGLYQGAAKINDNELSDWKIFPLEFKKSWINKLGGWRDVDGASTGPSLLKATLTIEEEPKDTFVYMEEWKKGIVAVNGFVLGRYARMGPVQTLYLPAPFLKRGDNEIVVFEHFKPAEEVGFSTEHVYARH